MIAVLSIIIAVLLLLLLINKRPVNVYVINETKPKPEKIEWDGTPYTPEQQKQVDATMKSFIEQMPEAGFFKQHPEYLDRYISQIDLSELDDSLKR